MEREHTGRGAQFNTENNYLSSNYVTTHIEGVDEKATNGKVITDVRFEKASKIVNKVSSPDLGMVYSANPYQGCEHGCIYCYARNTHTYWGYSAGLDFESKIIIKRDAPALLEKHILKNNWRVAPITFSGNTDCYQPLEKQHRLTRRCLEILLQYRHPVGLITKNNLITRDLDILSELAAYRLVHVYVSITTLNEDLRRKMEPRTTAASKRMEIIKKLSDANIPVGVMAAPIIPGLNHHEIPEILKSASENGAVSAGYTVLRLNGDVEPLFKDWLQKTYPNSYSKVIHQVEELHEGNVNDSNWGRRMVGKGTMSNSIADLFRVSKKKYFKDKSFPPYDLSAFRKGGNYMLF